MKTLAIHGHPTRGKEVIEILEMLGGINKAALGGNSLYIYYIDCNNHIDLSSKLQDTFVTFHLEEFLEKYPYKIGDKVQDKDSASYEDVYIIEDMIWENNQINYIVYNQSHKYPKCTVTAEYLQPYKEDGDMNQENENETTEINLNHPCFDGYNKVELIIPDNWEFKELEGKIFGVRKYFQYPKTIKECRELLETDCTSILRPGYKYKQFALFQELLICRDAYWKIADNWKPDFKNINIPHYCLFIDSKGDIIKDCFYGNKCILVFPTGEIRDKFLENFNGLIEKCKEFL